MRKADTHNRRNVADIVSALMAYSESIELDQVPNLMAAIASLQMTLSLRLHSAPNKPNHDNEPRLTIEEAAAYLRVSKDYIYRHWRHFPGAAKIGKRLTFCLSGLIEAVDRYGPTRHHAGN